MGLIRLYYCYCTVLSLSTLFTMPNYKEYKPVLHITASPFCGHTDIRTHSISGIAALFEVITEENTTTIPLNYTTIRIILIILILTMITIITMIHDWQVLTYLPDEVLAQHVPPQMTPIPYVHIFRLTAIQNYLKNGLFSSRNIQYQQTRVGVLHLLVGIIGVRRNLQGCVLLMQYGTF